jgi:hypothetical protein
MPIQLRGGWKYEFIYWTPAPYGPGSTKTYPQISMTVRIPESLTKHGGVGRDKLLHFIGKGGYSVRIADEKTVIMHWVGYDATHEYKSQLSHFAIMKKLVVAFNKALKETDEWMFEHNPIIARLK